MFCITIRNLLGLTYILKKCEVSLSSFQSVSKAIEDLDNLAQKVADAFILQELAECTDALRQYFYYIRYAHAYGVIEDTELEKRMRDWNHNMVHLFYVSPNAAFETAYEALKICSKADTGLLCDIVIVNSVSTNINAYVRPALSNHVKYEGYVTTEGAVRFIEPLMAILITLAPNLNSSNLQETFFEALTEFETILYTSVIPPARRFELVSKLRNRAENKPNCEVLLNRMNEILAEAAYLPNGRGLILHSMEEQADRLGQESKEWYQRNPVDIKSAFAIRAGVAVEYLGAYEQIEDALRNGKIDKAEQGLFDLFVQLSANNEDDNKSRKYVSTLSYWLKTALKLYDKSKLSAFNLSERCIEMIGTQPVTSEYAQAVVYGYSLPIISAMEGSDTLFVHRAVEMYKMIMKRSSEFVKSRNAEEIFEYAAIGFRNFLGTISPTARYQELSELENWLEGRNSDSLYLQDFVDDLINSRESYGNEWGIPLEEDETAIINSFSPRQP